MAFWDQHLGCRNAAAGPVYPGRASTLRYRARVHREGSRTSALDPPDGPSARRKRSKLKNENKQTSHPPGPPAVEPAKRANRGVAPKCEEKIWLQLNRGPGRSDGRSVRRSAVANYFDSDIIEAQPGSFHQSIQSIHRLPSEPAF